MITNKLDVKQSKPLIKQKQKKKQILKLKISWTFEII